jgi:cobalt/nickel transport system permease protein
MHIPDAYLSPATQAVSFAVMVPIWTLAARRTSRDLTTKQVPLLSIGAAFCFAIQMFNIPALGGTTAHALGATLLAILVGPWAAVLGMTLTLAIQALLFGDGGILTLGANAFDMAFVAPFVGYGIYRLISGSGDATSSRRLVGAAIGSYTGTVAASLCAGLILGAQPLLAHDALGHALYCPFGWGISVPAMVMTHLLVAAPAEAMITVAALSYLRHAFPELLQTQARPKLGTVSRLVRRAAWVLLLTPIGLIAGGDAFGEWDLSELTKLVGYAPAGIAHSKEIVHPMLPDYGFGGVSGKPWEILGYLASAVVGFTVVAIFTRSITRRAKVVPFTVRAPVAAKTRIPEWMRTQNAPLPEPKSVKAPWFETTVLRMRTVMERAMAGETASGQAGFLQRADPTLKAIGFLLALVATGLAGSPWLLILILAAAVFMGLLSQLPMRGLAVRVISAVMFFGLVLAIPVSLQAVSPGPSALRLGGVVLSTTGVHAGTMILLRLAAGITLALLWNSTTKWNQLLGSLGSLGVPRVVLSTATLTYRYVFVMMETLGEMVEARTSRQVGACDKHQARTYAGTGAAVLFAKSFALTEETHLAMLSRGFDGRIRRPAAKKPIGAVIAATGVAVLCALLLLGGFHAF